MRIDVNKVLAIHEDPRPRVEVLGYNDMPRLKAEIIRRVTVAGGIKVPVEAQAAWFMEACRELTPRAQRALDALEEYFRDPRRLTERKWLQRLSKELRHRRVRRAIQRQGRPGLVNISTVLKNEFGGTRRPLSDTALLIEYLNGEDFTAGEIAALLGVKSAERGAHTPGRKGRNVRPTGPERVVRKTLARARKRRALR